MPRARSEWRHSFSLNHFCEPGSRLSVTGTNPNGEAQPARRGMSSNLPEPEWPKRVWFAPRPNAVGDTGHKTRRTLDLINSEVKCVECGELGASERQTRRGNARTASRLLTAGRVAVPAGLLILLENVAAPAAWPRLPVLIAVGFLVFGVVCLRDGYRATPSGPVFTVYECPTCGHIWVPGKVARPKSANQRSGKVGPSGPRGGGAASSTRSSRRGRVRGRPDRTPGTGAPTRDSDPPTE